MLSTVGKIAAGVTMLGSFTLMNPKPINAMAGCTAEEQALASCLNGDGIQCGYDSGEYWCQEPSLCYTYEDGGGHHITFTSACVYNGPYACPGAAPCG